MKYFLIFFIAIGVVNCAPQKLSSGSGSDNQITITYVPGSTFSADDLYEFISDLSDDIRWNQFLSAINGETQISFQTSQSLAGVVNQEADVSSILDGLDSLSGEQIEPAQLLQLITNALSANDTSVNYDETSYDSDGLAYTSNDYYYSNDASSEDYSSDDEDNYSNDVSDISSNVQSNNGNNGIVGPQGNIGAANQEVNSGSFIQPANGNEVSYGNDGLVYTGDESNGYDYSNNGSSEDDNSSDDEYDYSNSGSFLGNILGGGLSLPGSILNGALSLPGSILGGSSSSSLPTVGSSGGASIPQTHIGTTVLGGGSRPSGGSLLGNLVNGALSLPGSVLGGSSSGSLSTAGSSGKHTGISLPQTHIGTTVLGGGSRPSGGSLLGNIVNGALILPGSTLGGSSSDSLPTVGSSGQHSGISLPHIGTTVNSGHHSSGSNVQQHLPVIGTAAHNGILPSSHVHSSGTTVLGGGSSSNVANSVHAGQHAAGSGSNHAASSSVHTSSTHSTGHSSSSSNQHGSTVKPRVGFPVSGGYSSGSVGQSSSSHPSVAGAANHGVSSLSHTSSSNSVHHATSHHH